MSVFGISYGAEAALLLGVHYPTLVHGVVALVPSATVTCALSEPALLCLPGSLWTFEGRPIPHTRLVNNERPWDVPAARIPVERIAAPVFLNCGEQDTVWASCRASRAIAATRHAHHLRTEMYAYSDAGHFVGSPYLVYEPGSAIGDIFVPGDERGREDTWPRLVRFLKTY